ncbi:MAG: 3-deoxy-manno-octulosonate cytidylyltransferase [Gammaproteobacteria bacterium]
MSFKVYIPARLHSTRLPGKLLREIGGVSILERVYRNACQSGADEVIVATDSELIEGLCLSFGAKVYITADTHQSGTDRIAEAARKNEESADQIVVNVQGDEPLLPAAVIHQVAEMLQSDMSAQIATVCEKIISTDESADPNICKVVTDNSGRALYFSRASIPHCREAADHAAVTDTLRRHVGIYGYRVGFLEQFVNLPHSPLETIEKLEQLRALENGFKIVVADAVKDCGFGIDTDADFQRFRALLESAANDNAS